MAEEAGEVVTCPQCGQEIKLHSMIPVLDGDGPGHRYLCKACARALIPAGDHEAPGDEAPPTEDGGATD